MDDPSFYREVDALLRRAILEDKDALGELCMAYKGMIANIVRSFLLNRDLAWDIDDVIGDVMVGIVAGFPLFNPCAGKASPAVNFTAWCNRVAKNECLEFVDKWRKRNEVPLTRTLLVEDGEEYEENHLDDLAVAAWMVKEKECPPPLQTRGPNTRYKPRVKKKEPPAKKPRGAHKKKTPTERRVIERHRQVFAAAAMEMKGTP